MLSACTCTVNISRMEGLTQQYVEAQSGVSLSRWAWPRLEDWSRTTAQGFLVTVRSEHTKSIHILPFTLQSNGGGSVLDTRATCKTQVRSLTHTNETSICTVEKGGRTNQARPTDLQQVLVAFFLHLFPLGCWLCWRWKRCCRSLPLCGFLLCDACSLPPSTTKSKGR